MRRPLHLAPPSRLSTPTQSCPTYYTLRFLQVSLTTTDQKDADFDGKAWITILGWSDQSAEMPLVLPGRTSGEWRRLGPRAGADGGAGVRMTAGPGYHPSWEGG